MDLWFLLFPRLADLLLSDVMGIIAAGCVRKATDFTHKDSRATDLVRRGDLKIYRLRRG